MVKQGLRKDKLGLSGDDETVMRGWADLPECLRGLELARKAGREGKIKKRYTFPRGVVT